MGKEAGCHLAHNVKVQNSTLAIQQSTMFGRYFDEITCFLTHVSVCGFYVAYICLHLHEYFAPKLT